MPKRKKVDKEDEQPKLCLDIHLNLDGLAQSDGPLHWLAQYAKVPHEPPSPDRLIGLAGKLYHARQLRVRFLNSSLLGEPVWDMLLALYCFSSSGRALSVSGLCHSAGVPQTTALRWVQVMEQKRLIRRSKDASDGRRVLVSLTDETKRLMDNYLAAIDGSSD